MRNYFVLCLVGFLLPSNFSCKKDPQIVPDSSVQKINFQNPEVGQVSQYVLLLGENIKHTANARFEYKTDTLIAKIVEQDGDKYLLNEYLTLGSASLINEDNVANPEDTVAYFLIKDPEMIRIQNTDRRKTSRLFFLRNAETEGLAIEEFHDLPLKMETWKPKIPFTKNYITGYLEAFSLKGETYDHLNVIIENRPMLNRSSGYSHIYSMKNGLVRSSTYSDITGKGIGWDLIP